MLEIKKILRLRIIKICFPVFQFTEGSMFLRDLFVFFIKENVRSRKDVYDKK